MIALNFSSAFDADGYTGTLLGGATCAEQLGNLLVCAIRGVLNPTLPERASRNSPNVTTASAAPRSEAAPRCCPSTLLFLTHHLSIAGLVLTWCCHAVALSAALRSGEGCGHGVKAAS